MEKHSESILKSFIERPPMNACEAKVRIEKMTGISRSPSQVGTFMKHHGLRYIKTGHIPSKADTQKQQQWVKSTLEPAIIEAQNGECHLLFMDAAHFILEPFISAETIIVFLNQLKEHYGDLSLKIVLDNARYQHCKLVGQAAKSMGITLLFLPSYSPNLNIIERLWKFTRETILYAKYYETPASFHQAITDFFQKVNLKHNDDLKNILTLKFQFFSNENVLSNKNNIISYFVVCNNMNIFVSL